MSIRTKLAGLGRRLTQFLLVEEIRTAVALIRYVFYRLLLRRMKVLTAGSDGISENALFHNRRKILRSVLKSQRTNILIKPLVVIPRVRLGIRDAKVLVIGPRAEAELLNLLGHGFRWRNITGLDLFSYSPKIDVGDMHAMPYENDSFGVVIAMAVLGYSDSPGKAAQEMIRVTRPGGVIAIEARRPTEQSELRKGWRKLGYSPGAKETLKSFSELLELFGDSVDHVYHVHDPTKEPEEYRGFMVAIFSIRK